MLHTIKNTAMWIVNMVWHRCHHENLEYLTTIKGNPYGAVGMRMKQFRCKDCGAVVENQVWSNSLLFYTDVGEYPRYFFFLGGNDLEMKTISQFLHHWGFPLSDAKLGWGAKASAYTEQLGQVEGVPVLIELEPDIPLPLQAVILDHHGMRAGEQASLVQLLQLLSTKPTRSQQLVAAEDAGSYFGLVNFGATPEEIETIMRESRAVQGFTPEMEEASAAAVNAAENIEGLDLVVVRLPFSKFAAAKAILWLQGRKNMIFVASDGEVEFQGDGEVCQLLKDHFTENSWCGGAGLGHSGRFDAFWGGYHPSEDVIAFVKHHLA